MTLRPAHSYTFPVLQVLIPSNEYNGHTPATLVTVNIPAIASNTNPHVPPITRARKRAAKIAAASILTTRSVVPMFFFISFCLDNKVENRDPSKP